MLYFALTVRWFIYLILSNVTSEGSNRYPRQMDSKYVPSSINSSPNLFNTSEQLYSAWSSWTPCSVTCGNGVSSRTRNCLKSTYNARGVSIPLCHGDFAEHKVCKMQRCSTDSPSFRDIQCSYHNNKVVAGKYVKLWKPTNSGTNPCELRCEAEAETLVYSFGKVSNGTPCPLGVCLDGRCLPVGCDDRLGSEVSLDMCGVCGGRNASCVHYKDVYKGQPSTDGDRRNAYREVAVIPVGARNLIVRNTIGKNLLALQDRNKGIIFNSQLLMTKHGTKHEIAGMTVEFPLLDNATEAIVAKGPVAEELYVLVLLRASNRGIYYEYWLPQQHYSHKHYPIHPPVYYPSTASPRVTPPVRTSSSRPTMHYHPTKPAYAYGYGEKPYKGKDAPIFRHAPSTTSTPNYDSKQKYAFQVTPLPQPIRNQYSVIRKDDYLLYKRRYVTEKPVGGFYQNFRNVSSLDTAKAKNTYKELPVLTQQDSSSSNGKEGILSSSFFNDKKSESSKSSKPPRSIPVDKRLEKPVKNYVPNGRLKYSFDIKDSDEVFTNSTGRYTASPLSIAVLPLPDSRNDKPRKGKVKGGCEPCQRNRDQTKHFCESDFVVRALIIDYEFLNGETRYELDIIQTFKNTLSLLPKEYVWSPDTCRCPRLRPGKEYLIMGRVDNTYKKRESRLLVDKFCFVRTFNLKYARRLQKLRKDQTKKCKKTS